MKFTIVGEPIPKGRPKFSRNGNYVKTYTPEKTVNYENLVKYSFWKKYPNFKPYTSKTALRIKIVLKFVPVKSVSKKMRERMIAGEVKPTKKPDIDNCIKSILDGLHDVLYVDDNCVAEVEAVKEYAESPEAVVEIEEISEGA